MGRPGRARSAPPSAAAPPRTSTLIATLRANHGSSARWRPSVRARRRGRRARRSYSARLPVRPDVAPLARPAHAASSAKRHADRGERVVDEHRPARRDAPAPADEVRARRPEAVRAVDVQQRERPGDVAVRVGGELAHVAHAVGDARGRQVGAGTPRESASPREASAAISCGPRSLPACGSIATTEPAASASTTVERPRKDPISTTAPAGRARERRGRQPRACASVSQPSIARRRARSTRGRRAAARASPMASTDSAAAACSASTIAAKVTSDFDADRAEQRDLRDRDHGQRGQERDAARARACTGRRGSRPPAASSRSPSTNSASAATTVSGPERQPQHGLREQPVDDQHRHRDRRRRRASARASTGRGSCPWRAARVASGSR